MRINKVIFGFTVVMAALLSSCNQDNEGAIYNSTNAGLSFTASTMAQVTVPASQPVFEVEIFRGNTSGAASGSLSISGVVGKDPISGLTVSGYNFADGSNRTTVSVDVSSLEVGQLATVTLTISDADASVGGVKETSMKVSKAYEWTSLGIGTYTDSWTTASDDYPDGITANVEILKANGFDRYRIMAPYKEYLASPEGIASWDNWIASSSTAYVEFYTEDGIIYYEDFFLGLNYSGDKSQPIYACHPSGWSSLSSDHNIWIDAKTAQFAPYFYIDGVGGWNYSQYDGVIIVTLP